MPKVTRRTFKYRLYPTKAQASFLKDQLREACDLYNCAIQERRDAWKTCRKSINYYDQANQIKAMRTEGLIGLLHYQSCQDVLQRVDRTFKAFFRRARRGEAGYPRYKSFRRYDSLTYPSYGSGCKLVGNRLRVQGAGQLRINLHRPVQGKIKIATIKRDVGKWFVCLLAEVDPEPLPTNEASIGIDVGLKSFAVLSDGTDIKNPRHLSHSTAILQRRQRKLARRKKTSRRRAKARTLLAKAYQKVANQRSDFHHKISRSLVNAYGVIAIEDLNIKCMASGSLAKSVRDVAWSYFFTKLSYKAEDAGRELVKVDPRGTSQMCLCGAGVPKGLWDRIHNCTSCGLSGDRDHVSAQVILQRARNVLSGANVAGIDASVAREAVAKKRRSVHSTVGEVVECAT